MVSVYWIMASAITSLGFSSITTNFTWGTPLGRVGALCFLMAAFVCGMGRAALAAEYTPVILYTINGPSGFYAWGPNGNAGTQYVGSGYTSGDNNYYHALMWNGNGTPIDLTPDPATNMGAQIYATTGSVQVGGYSDSSTGGNMHAVTWTGSVASAVDHQPTNQSSLPNTVMTAVSGSQEVGYGWPANIDTPNHALLWTGPNTAVDLSPTNLPAITSSIVKGTDGAQQVGVGQTASSVNHALLWNGTSTAIDLSPTNLTGFSGSVAYGVFGGKQVGTGTLTGSTNQDALLWSGSANTAVDLGPAGYTSSAAVATNGQSEVGWGFGPATSEAMHALLWNGTNVPVDLQALLPSGYYSSNALSIDANGDVFGYATDSTNYDLHAVEWVAVPEPTSLFAAPLLALVTLRRPRRARIG